MPVFNSAAWIESAIESVLGQSVRDLELIISDNASTDATFAICERYAREDPRVRLYRNDQNIGANRNYLAVLARATAPYFKWASSNDICAPTFIEKCVAALDRCPDAVLAFTRASLFENDPTDATSYDRDIVLSSHDAGERFITLLSTIGLNNPFNGVFRRAALTSATPMGNFQRADIAFMAELAMMGKFLLVPEPLFFRRMSPESATKLQSEQRVDQHLAPHARRPLRMQNWLFYLSLLRIAWRHGPLHKGSMRALSYVLQQMRWSRGALAQDIRNAVLPSRWTQ